MKWSKYLVLWTQVVVVSAASAKAPVSIPTSSSTGASRSEAPAVQFSTEQQDRIIADDYIRRNDSAIFQFSAIAYAVWGAENNFDRKGAFRVDNWAADTSSISVYQNHLAAPKTKADYLSLAAQNQSDAIKGFKVRGTSGEALLNSALGVASFGLGPSAPIVMPLLKEGVLRAIEVSPQDPNVAPDAARNMVGWASDQIRRDTPAGKVLAKYMNDLKIADPRKDRSDSTAVRAAQAAYLNLKTSRDVQKLLEGDKNLKEAVDQMRSRLEKFTEALKASGQYPGSKEIIEIKPDYKAAEFFRNSASSLTSMSYILAMANHAKEAEMIERMARVAKAMELASTAAQYSAMAAVNIYAYAAFMIYSAIKISTAPKSPYPEIFKMLARISKQIEDLRAELGMRLNQMDSKLSAFIAQSNAFNEGQLQNANVVNQVLSRLQIQLSHLQLAGEQQARSMVSLQLNAEDRNCFQEYQKSKYLSLSTQDFVKCRSTYVDRATQVARSWLTDGTPSAATKGVVRMIALPDANLYESVRLRVDQEQKEYSRVLAHPTVWAQSAQLLSRLAKSQPQYIKSFEGQLDGVLEAGSDLRKFRDTLLFTYSNGKKTFRKERVESLLNQAANIQGSALAKIQQQLLATGTTVDPTKGFSQPFNRDYPFQFMTQTTPFCEGVAPRVHSHIVVRETSPGCGTGCVHVHDVSTRPPGHNEAVRATLNAGFKGVTADTLGWDKRILRVIAPELLLAEQSNYLRTRLHICISRMDLSEINQQPNMYINANLGVGLNVYASADTPEGRTAPIFVQAIDMQVGVGGQGLGAILDHEHGPQVRRDFLHNWSNFWEVLSTKGRDVSTPETLKAREIVKARMNEFFAKYQSSLAAPLVNALQAEEQDFNEVVRDLKAMMNIGLRNGGEDSRKIWNAAVASQLAPNTPIRMAQLAVSMGTRVESLSSALAGQHQTLKEALEGLAKDERISPPEDVISGVLRSLNQIYWQQVLSVAKKR